MARERGRRSFSLSDEAQEVLDRIDNYSGYIDALIKQHARDWTEALALLTGKGWHGREILAACDALGGYALTQWSRRGAFIAQELERAETRQHVFTEHEVTQARRARCMKQLARNPSVATALAVVVREYHLPNDDCRSAVRALRA